MAVDDNKQDTMTALDRKRLRWLTCAELFDAWRVVPRMLLIGYGYAFWAVIDWYMNLKPTLLENCNKELLADFCISNAPTTQHSILVSATVGAAAVVFGLYTSTGREWNRSKFIKWDDSNMQRSNDYINKQRRRGNNRDFYEQSNDSFWADVSDSEYPDEDIFPNRPRNGDDYY